MLAEQLRLLFKGVLSGFKPSDNHRVNHSIDFKIGQRAVERFIVHLGKPTDHVFAGFGSTGRDVALNISFEGIEFFKLRLGLSLCQ